MNRFALGLTITCAALLGVAAWCGVFGRGTTVPPGPQLQHDVRPGPGTAQTLLSAYGPGLAGTPGDTPVYILRGASPGGTALVIAGTHGNEIAGIVAAVVLVEHARVTRGRVIVVPHANNSAMSYADPVRPGPDWVTLEGASGPRRFRYGARRTNPAHQGSPDPPVYRHPAAGEPLAGVEARNLARAYVGDPQGTLTRRIAAAIVRLVEDERADIVVDLHENEPDAPLAWAIVSHPEDRDLALEAAARLEEEGLEMVVETSVRAPRGVSHREIGDATPARAFLLETPNPAQVRHSQGVDVVTHPELPLARRVGAHLSGVRALLAVHNAHVDDAARVDVRDLPTWAEVMAEGVGRYLR